VLGVCSLLVLAVAGCTPGINWRAFAYDPQSTDPAAKNALRFVYFRNFSIVACTHFEEEVLAKEPVRNATADLYCIVVDFYVDRKLAEDWGVRQAPAVVLLDPDENVLARIAGSISQDELLATIRKAKEDYAKAPRQPRTGVIP
jgi:hypothetical protein